MAPNHNRHKHQKRQPPKLCVIKAMQYAFSQDIDPILLSQGAKDIAHTFGHEFHLIDGEASKKPVSDSDNFTQVRKFYDEVVKLNDRCKNQNFDDISIYVHMLPAKSAYAKGRKHVSYNFNYFITHGVKQITCAKSLHNFKLLFESVLGFYKEIKPK